MAYVPPALRRKQIAGSEGKAEESSESMRQPSNTSAKDETRSLRDIQKYFWPSWVLEAPVLARNLQEQSTEAGELNRKLNEHGDAIADENNTALNPKSVSKAPHTTRISLDSSTEADGKVETRSDASQQAHQTVQRELKESDKVTVSSSQQVKDSEPEEASAANQTISSVDNGKDDKARNPRGTLGADMSVIESVHPHNTLNSTEQSPDSLQYVLLFYDANPRWQGDHIIYVKSALELLPTAKLDNTTQEPNSSTEPLAKNIMVFEQQNGHRTPTSAMFKFIGYFNLTKMQILEPQTPELVRMQEQKWTRKDKYGRSKPINRNAESWKKSLSQRWAVLGFERDEKATEELRPPQIESSRRGMHDGTQEGTRSVNDMLKEMRLSEGS